MCVDGTENIKEYTNKTSFVDRSSQVSINKENIHYLDIFCLFL